MAPRCVWRTGSTSTNIRQDEASVDVTIDQSRLEAAVLFVERFAGAAKNKNNTFLRITLGIRLTDRICNDELRVRIRFEIVRLKNLPEEMRVILGHTRYSFYNDIAMEAFV